MSFTLILVRLVAVSFLFFGVAAIAAGIEYEAQYMGESGAVCLGVFAVLEKISRT